jgi:queuosine biosynthesis protein QueC
MATPKAVVLLSGGMDSATAAAVALDQGFEVYALSFRYGQRHATELEAARRVAEQLGLRRQVVLDIDLRAFGGSALTGDLRVPKDTPLERIGSSIPATYVPARNTIFLSFALGWAETLGASDIFLGANALDYSGYPDCRPEYIEAFERMANLATRAGVEGSPAPHPHPIDQPVEGRDREAGDAARRGIRADLELLRPRGGRHPVRPLRRLHPEAQGLQGGGDGGSDILQKKREE